MDPSVGDHAPRGLDTLSNAVQHRWVDLIVVFLQVLLSDAPHTELVIRELVIGHDELGGVLRAHLVVTQAWWLLVEELVNGVARVISFCLVRNI